MLHYIKTFLEVVKCNSMVQAARQLNITPAAVSKHIQALEKFLSVELFKRTTRNIMLTEAGTIYYGHAKQLIDAHESSLAAISSSKEEISGHLKVVLGSQFVDDTLLPNLKKFIEKYPKIFLELQLSQNFQDLENENIDVIVGFTRGIPVNCIQRKVREARWVLCGSKQYFEENSLPKELHDVEKYRLLTHSNREPSNTIAFKNGEKITFPSVLCFNDTRLIKKGVVDGLGIAYLHDYIVEKELQEGSLVEIFKDFVDPTPIVLYLAYLQSKHLHIKIRKFVDFILEESK